MSSHKESTRKALVKFLEKQERKNTPSRKNAKPEKDVEKECLALMRSWGWKVEIYESKANFDPRTGRWRQNSMKAGTCDCMGLMPDGTSVAIEFKAPGKVSTLNKNENQRDFLEERIKFNAFAAVVDSGQRLKDIFNKWSELRNIGTVSAQKYLLDMLPPRKKDDGGNPFDGL